MLNIIIIEGNFVNIKKEFLDMVDRLEYSLLLMFIILIKFFVEVIDFLLLYIRLYKDMVVYCCLVF